MTLRHFLSWKPLFYKGLLPTLRAFGPRRGDALLGAFGRGLATVWPPRRRELDAALEQARAALGPAATWDRDATREALEANIFRFLARDCQLDGADDASFLGRFDVTGLEHLEQARALGKGVILLGCHLGPHLVAPHWLYRRGWPLRMLIQRPAHVSARLNAEFDIHDGPHPQAGFFLRRQLTPEEASKRVFRTRSALRDGLIVYLKGDVPWHGSNTRPGHFLGQDHDFQSLWAEFAALFRAPVVPVFCSHLPDGRYAVTFDPPMTIVRGEEGLAVTRYLARLQARIAAQPAVAVGHLLWPCYGPPRARHARERDTARPPGRRTPTPARLAD